MSVPASGSSLPRDSHIPHLTLELHWEQVGFSPPGDGGVNELFLWTWHNLLPSGGVPRGAPWGLGCCCVCVLCEHRQRAEQKGLPESGL